MNVVAWILGMVLVAVFLFAGGTKVIDLDRQREHFGYTVAHYRLIGLSEIAAAIGIVVGLVWRSLEWLALAAGIGVCALMIGALIAHARVGDQTKQSAPAMVVFAVAVGFVIATSIR